MLYLYSTIFYMGVAVSYVQMLCPLVCFHSAFHSHNFGPIEEFDAKKVFCMYFANATIFLCPLLTGSFFILLSSLLRVNHALRCAVNALEGKGILAGEKFYLYQILVIRYFFDQLFAVNLKKIISNESLFDRLVFLTVELADRHGHVSVMGFAP